MTKFSDEFKSQAQKREKERIGDVYETCIKLGCTKNFVEVFNFRAEHYPIQQTKAFIERPNPQYLKQWRIYLKTLVDMRPNHEKLNEIKQAYDLLIDNT